MAFVKALQRPDRPFICSADAFVAEDFAKVAVNLILKGESVKKGFSAAAKHLKISVDEVELAVSMVSSIFIRAARLKLSMDQILAFLADLKFDEASRQAIAEIFSQRAYEIRAMVAVPLLYVPSYHRLDWRLDVQVASRSLRNQSNPSFLLKLCTKSFHAIATPEAATNSNKDVGKRVHYFEADYATLKRICQQLEQALAEREGMLSGITPSLKECFRNYSFPYATPRKTMP